MAYDTNFDTIKTGPASTGRSYKDAFDANKVIEEKIGLSLATNGAVPELAKQIATKSGIATQRTLTTGGATSGVDQMGGARAYDEGWDTMGSSVLAVMHEIEKDPNNKTKYSTSKATSNNPRFISGAKKPEFDEPLYKADYINLPNPAKVYLNTNMRNTLTTYNQLEEIGKKRILQDCRFDSTAAKDTATALKTKVAGVIPFSSTLQTALQALDADPNNEKERVAAITEIKAAMATANPDEKAQLGALLDIVVDKHSSGDNTNIVRRDPLLPTGKKSEKNQWIDDTIAAGKPIISGPSGHTLRYLNFWAEKRDAQNTAETTPGYAGTELVKDWPSLEAARLVMMANLMPPKHHSYDEIMTSSIGITSPQSKTLAYKHKSSYLDLAIHEEPDAEKIARQAYTDSGAYNVKSDYAFDKGIDNPTGSNKANEEGLIDTALQALQAVVTSTPGTTPKEITDAITALNTEKSALPI